MRFSNINMSSPSLPRNGVRCKTSTMYPALHLKKLKLRRADLEFGPICRHMGPGYLPFLCFTMSWDHASTTSVCVNTHCNASVVHFFVIWITILLLLLWRITRNRITQASVKLPLGEKTRLTSLEFHNETRSGGFLDHG